MKKCLRLLLILLICGLSLPAFAAGKMPADGEYSIEGSLSGGSGRAHIESPLKIQVKDGQITAHLVWSSKNYTWMEAEGVRYDAVMENEHSAFDIPIRLDEDMAVKAETVAMSEPHVIEYVLRFDSATLSGGPSPAGSRIPWRFVSIAAGLLLIASGTGLYLKKKQADKA